MRTKLEEKQLAISLRKQGLSYNEIKEIVPVSKSTLSSWFKFTNFTDKEIADLREKIKLKQDNGRWKAALSNHDRRVEREKSSFEEAENDFEIFKNDLLFVIGVALYWAEGSKSGNEFHFVNSDSEMIRFMIFWIEKYLGISRDFIKFRLYIHKVYDHENCEGFWENVVGISKEKFQKTIYKPTQHNVKKNPNYKGCLRLTVSKVHNLRKVMAWQKLLIKYHSTDMHP